VQNLLSIVVTCTKRKSAVPPPELRARSLPRGSVSCRGEVWADRLRRCGDRRPAIGLYQGEHWTQVQRLIAVASSAGYEPRLWIASAGLGLQPADAVVPAYAATFSTGADRVAADTREAREWWQGLQTTNGHTTLSALAAVGSLLLVLSETYANALATELDEAGRVAESDILLVGGARDVAGIRRVRADASLRSALGGTLTSLNTRIAASWLERADPRRMSSESVAAPWSDWAAGVRTRDGHQRRRTTDGQVVDAILKLAANDSHVSRSRALRLLRDGGLACEQQRFARLFRGVQEAL
jgi:hypothetical protein